MNKFYLRYTFDRRAKKCWDSIHEHYDCCGLSGTWDTKTYLGSVPDSCFKDTDCLELIRLRLNGKVSPHLELISVGSGILALLGMATALLALLASAEIRRIEEAEEVDERLQVDEDLSAVSLLFKARFLYI